MERELKYLLLTKVGFVIAMLPWVALALVGTASGLWSSAIPRRDK